MKKIEFNKDVLMMDNFILVEVGSGIGNQRCFVLSADLAASHDIQISDCFDYEQFCYQIMNVKEDNPKVLLFCKSVDENKLKAINL